MTDNYSDDEFAPIAAAIKRLPYFVPSSQFSDSVMARVRIAGHGRLPVAAVPRAIASAPLYRAPEEFRRPAVPAARDFSRSVPARLAAVALLASLTVTMAVVAMVAIFNVDVFVFVARIFGESAISFLASLGAGAASSAAGTAATSAAAAGTAVGAAAIASFAIGVALATAGLRVAASASRRAA